MIVTSDGVLLNRVTVSLGETGSPKIQALWAQLFIPIVTPISPKLYSDPLRNTQFDAPVGESDKSSCAYRMEKQYRCRNRGNNLYTEEFSRSNMLYACETLCWRLHSQIASGSPLNQTQRPSLKNQLGKAELTKRWQNMLALSHFNTNSKPNTTSFLPALQNTCKSSWQKQMMGKHVCHQRRRGQTKRSAEHLYYESKNKVRI